MYRYTGITVYRFTVINTSMYSKQRYMYIYIDNIISAKSVFSANLVVFHSGKQVSIYRRIVKS